MLRHLSPAIVLLACFSVVVHAQYLADPEFKPTVEHPAYGRKGPRVMFDEAHNNYHTSSGRYRPFVDLIANDGYQLVINRQPFEQKILSGFKVLVIVNALGDDIDEPNAESPAFTDEECKVIKEWVRDGGSLLLIATAGPFAKATANLAKIFDIEFGGAVVEDPSNAADASGPSFIVYSRENHLLVEHPITQGRSADEKVNRIIAFAGQSVKVPDSAIPFLKLSSSAVEVGTEKRPVFAQAAALKAGKGKVVVFGESDMLTALLEHPPEKKPLGMNYPGIDNKQLALNVIHWLSGLL